MNKSFHLVKPSEIVDEIYIQFCDIPQLLGADTRKVSKTE